MGVCTYVCVCVWVGGPMCTSLAHMNCRIQGEQSAEAKQCP